MYFENYDEFDHLKKLNDKELEHELIYTWDSFYRNREEEHRQECMFYLEAIEHEIKERSQC